MISYIIPVYQAENFISKCIESILKQKYKDIEIILIDDGSTDKSFMICDDYAFKYEIIKVIHQKNSGVSTARNIGIQYSKGEFIQFVDADDTIEDEMSYMLFNKIKGSLTDLCLCGYNFINNGIITKIPLYEKVYEKKDFKEDLIPQFFVNPKNNCVLHGSVCKGIFKKEIITNYNLMFKNDIKYCEDLLFLLEYISKCNKVSFISECLYNYFYHGTNSTAKYVKDMDENIIKLEEYLLEYFHKNNLFSYKKNIDFLSFTILKYYLIFIKNELKSKNKLISIYKKTKYIREKIKIDHYIVNLKGYKIKIMPNILWLLFKNKIHFPYLFFYKLYLLVKIGFNH